MSREGLGYGFAGALTEDDAGEDTEGAESVNGISGGSISWLAEGGYHVGGYGEVHCPGVGRLFAFELGEPVVGGVCQALVVRGIAVRNAGFAIASAADGETPVTWSEVGVGVRRGVPEEGEVVREISREGERVDTLIWLYGRSHGAYKATGGDDRAVGISAGPQKCERAVAALVHAQRPGTGRIVDAVGDDGVAVAAEIHGFVAHRVVAGVAGRHRRVHLKRLEPALLRVELVHGDRRNASRDGTPETTLHFHEPVSVIDRGEDAGVCSKEALVLQLEVFGQRQHDVIDQLPRAVVSRPHEP